jgi:hypothetical protein
MAKVKVTFIDAETGAIVGQAVLEPAQLPESFAAVTTLHLGSDDWQVAEADPMTRLEYAISGRLLLRLRKVQLIDPKDMLFLLPTIEDLLPSLGEAGVDSGCRLHEDDWRQWEFVAGGLSADIEAELEAVRAIRAQAVGIGFKTCHLRQRIPDPLAGVDLRLSEVAASMETAGAARTDVVLGGRRVERGFAFQWPGGTVYGTEDAGRVTCLAITDRPEQPLLDLAKSRNLVLVDWVRADSEPRLDRAVP